MKQAHPLTLAVLLGLFLNTPAQADWWSESRQTAGELWDKTRSSADQAVQEAQQWLNQEAQDDFSQVWQGVVPKLEQALDLSDQQAQLPENAWFGRDQVSNQQAIDQLMDEAAALLSHAPAQRTRDRVRELEQAIRDTRSEIAQYRERQIAAPSDAVLRKSAEDYDRAIQAATERLVTLQRELAETRQRFAEELKTIGLDLSAEQVEFLLSTVTGDDLIELGVAFDNVKALTGQLEQLMVQSQEDSASARRYYGMYVILLNVLAHMQEQLLVAVEERYLRDIDAIRSRTEQLMQETRSFNQRADLTAEAAATLRANLAAQELTLRTAGLYRDYLVAQARDVAAARERLQKDIAVATNTYETVKVSGELVQLLRTSQEALAVLLDRQVPVLRPFQNLEMQREFEQLTERLRAGETL